MTDSYAADILARHDWCQFVDEQGACSLPAGHDGDHTAIPDDESEAWAEEQESDPARCSDPGCASCRWED